jgi:16S rRNA C1402 (ribose-2'-O) methylase RsmI
MNFSVETKIIRTEKIKEQEEKDKKELKELAEDKDMSLMLEYFYALTADADDGSDVMGYFRSVKNHGLVGVTEDIYTFSNENLDHLFKKVNVKGKKVLTVGSGGDQAIYSIYKGAREVDLIDANVLTKAIVELKLAAIKAFDLNIFCEFMQVLTHGGEKLRNG